MGQCEPSTQPRGVPLLWELGPGLGTAPWLRARTVQGSGTNVALHQGHSDPQAPLLSSFCTSVRVPPPQLCEAGAELPLFILVPQNLARHFKSKAEEEETPAYGSLQGGSGYKGCSCRFLCPLLPDLS